jgi:hypothetical protein
MKTVTRTAAKDRADNDPSWSAPLGAVQLEVPQSPEPLRKKAGIPQQIIKAWLYRMLESAGPPV